MSNVKAHAQDLAEQHESGELLVLPTVWDTWSATVAAEAGFSGLTIGSHPVADAIGSADGENMNFSEYLEVIKRIVDTVDLPVSADVEAGYGLQAEELITRLLEAGAVGAKVFGGEVLGHAPGSARGRALDGVLRARDRVLPRARRCALAAHSKASRCK